MSIRTMTFPPLEHTVQRMYEVFPYPHYPLLGKPCWQDGYLASSKFAGRLFEDLTCQEAAINSPTGPFLKYGRTILIAGSGETLPYVLRQIEPRRHRLLCVDLSRRSLRRAKFRVGLLSRHTDFVHSDINRYLRQQASVTGPFNHIDAYGVLHHLKNPSETLNLMASHLSSNGTMRIMVYNRDARRWIHEIQTAFRLLKLDPYLKEDRELGRRILRDLAACSPALDYKIKCLGTSTLNNDARFVDTFLHVREAKIPPAQWFEIFERATLVPFAVIDRYGELDDLPNPLWHVPETKELVRRASNHSFENNLEVYLHKRHLQTTRSRRFVTESSSLNLHLARHLLRRPPRLWFSFPETETVGHLTRFRLWNSYLRHTSKIPSEPIDKVIKHLDEATIARLCRLGAILPRQIKDPGLRTVGLAPMTTESLDGLVRRDMANFDALPIKNMIEERLSQIDHRRTQRLALVMEHLKRAQILDLETYRKFG